jgi:hypothetical protein
MSTPPIKDIIAAAGGAPALAKKCNVDRSTVYGWGKVPPQHLAAVVEATGIPAHVLRPDLAAAFAPTEAA